jgi:hypothetical protein
VIDLFAPKPDNALYTWMVSEVSYALAAEGVRLIRARATCSVLKAALEANRFRAGNTVPVFTYPKMGTPPKRLHMTLNHSDACMRPYPREVAEVPSTHSSSAFHVALGTQ